MSAWQQCISSRFIIVMQKQQQQQQQQRRPPDFETVTSELVSGRAELGRSYLHLRNACVLPDGKRVILFRGRNESREYIVDLPLLAESEDYGFLYTSLEIFEIDVSRSDRQLMDAARDLWSGAAWHPNTSMLIVPVVTNHIVHSTENLVPLMAYADEVRASDWFDVHMKVLVASEPGSRLYDWLQSIYGLINLWMQRRLSLPVPPLEFHFQEHVFGHGEVEAACFEDLVLLGRTNTHKKFYPSSSIAHSFRSFVYEQLGIESDERLRSPSLISRSGILLRPTIKMKLRVTVVLRTKLQRRILNLHQLLYSLLNSEISVDVDKEWLMTHVVTLETMSFRDQIVVLADTDVLITSHGAAVFAGHFMREGSVVLQLFTSHFLEQSFTVPLHSMGVEVLDVVHTVGSGHHDTGDANRYLYSDCDDAADHCFDGSLEHGASFECIKMRDCSANMSITQFEAAFVVARAHIIARKFTKL